MERKSASYFPIRILKHQLFQSERQCLKCFEILIVPGILDISNVSKTEIHSYIQHNRWCYRPPWCVLVQAKNCIPPPPPPTHTLTHIKCLTFFVSLNDELAANHNNSLDMLKHGAIFFTQYNTLLYS